MQVNKWISRMIGVSGLFISCILIGPLFDDMFHLWLGEGLKLKKRIAKSSTAQE